MVPFFDFSFGMPELLEDSESLFMIRNSFGQDTFHDRITEIKESLTG